MSGKYTRLLDTITETGEPEKEHFHTRILIVDALNLFFRNFATMNLINADGAHIGGLAGTLRSLGSMIKLINPTGVYFIFDGVGSSNNRKNVMPEYKSTRGIKRITNFDSFEDIEDENSAKINQISRLVHYLQCLPIKVGTIEKAEADDMIAYLAQQLPQRFNSNITIVSSDKDYIQLVSPKVTLYRPTQKKFYNTQEVLAELGVLPKNYILVKCLLGDGSDAISGIKGLGLKTVLKLFPELSQRVLTLDDIFIISEKNLVKNKGYARILSEKFRVKKNFTVMDLATPILDDKQVAYIENLIKQDRNTLNEEVFLSMYETDGIGNFIKNTQHYLRETYTKLNTI